MCLEFGREVVSQTIINNHDISSRKIPVFYVKAEQMYSLYTSVSFAKHPGKLEDPTYACLGRYESQETAEPKQERNTGQERKKPFLTC